MYFVDCYYFCLFCIGLNNIYIFNKNLICYILCSIGCLKFCYLLRMILLVVFVFVFFVVLDICYGFFKNLFEYEINCNVNGSKIYCIFFVLMNWLFVEFRIWLDEIKGNVIEVNLNFWCLDGGSVFLFLLY